MTENFELLEIGQIEIMHEQVHSRLGEDANCDELRIQHDSLAAELVKRGLAHDTEIVCPEIETNAPNYRHGFTDDVCTSCAFGQLSPFCNLYKFDYLRGYTCDSFRYFEILDLEPPHGFLMANGKQTAYANIEKLDTDKAHLIISNGEVFGIAEFEELPTQLKTKEFDTEEWLNQHRVTPRERRQWWSDNEVFYIYRLKAWHPYEGIKLYEDDKVIDEPRLTADQWQIVSKAKELPKQITLVNDAVLIDEKHQFSLKTTFPHIENLTKVLQAAYEVKPEYVSDGNELIPLYSLALVRNPRMRVSKKNTIVETVKIEASDNVGIGNCPTTIAENEKQEGETMPFGIVKREDEFCVINTDTEEIQACHETEEEAEAQLAALRINVETEEGESDIYSDKPRKRKPKPRKKAESSENEKKAGFMDNLKTLSKSITSFLKSAENEENKGSLFMGKAGIGQKLVNGELWHFTYSTNAFEDREKEIFSTNALKSYVLQAKEKQDKGFFNLWHIEGTDFARKEWQDVFGRFLIEAGPYLNDEKGRAAKEFFKEYGEGHSDIAPEGWGCSPEFRYLPEERETGTYENIWITRTSTLPKFAAANVWTETRQLARSKMAITDYSEDQIKTAIEVFKDEDFVKSLIREAELKTTELENARVAHKGDSESDQPEPQEIQLNMEDLATEVSKQFQIDFKPIAEAMATMASGLKNVEERLEKVEGNKHIEEKTETPRFIFNVQRASEHKETIVTDDDGLKKQKPTETQANDGDSWSQLFNK